MDARPVATLPVLLLLVAGCASPPTFRISGTMERAMTQTERDEFVRVTGHEPEIVSTLMYCGPEVDPYDCNAHGLSVDGLTQQKCRAAVTELASRTYWRSGPVCTDAAAA